jgi:hypothetical protein
MAEPVTVQDVLAVLHEEYGFPALIAERQVVALRRMYGLGAADTTHPNRRSPLVNLAADIAHHLNKESTP